MEIKKIQPPFSSYQLAFKLSEFNIDDVSSNFMALNFLWCLNLN